MYLKFPRIGIAGLVSLGLAACSGQSTVPSAAQQGFASETAAIAATKSPCAIKGIYNFKGTCLSVAVKNGGGAAKLSAYKGLALTVGFGKSNANGATFLLADGTSSADITGTMGKGKVPFPNYGGKTPCFSLQTGKQTKCAPGSGVMYFVAVNTAANAVTFKTLPGVKITSTGAFPAKKSCTMIVMAFSPNGPGGWFLLPSTAKPSGSSVQLPPVQSPFTFNPNGNVILGAACN
jgi:hypothetical protein